MPGRGGRRYGRVNEDSRHLVSSREDLSLMSSSTDNVLFSIDGDGGEQAASWEASALEDTQRRSKADQTVRFQEHVHVIAPPLWSTLKSREAGTYFIFFARLSLRHRRCRLLRESVFAILIEFEPDSDDLDDDAIAHANLEYIIRNEDFHREQSTPLFVGLADASAGEAWTFPWE